MNSEGVYYGDYLQLGRILHAQSPESSKKGAEAHDEMLFIIIHQAYELWFKQILHELFSVRTVFNQPLIQDNSPDLSTAVHRMERVTTILKVLVHQIDIIETMTPLDFLDFRNMLRPASGFQSVQFKLVEAALGLKLSQRHGKAYYLSQLRQEDIEIIQQCEAQPSLVELLNGWLERMPFFDNPSYWQNTPSSEDTGIHPFWAHYRTLYMRSLVEGEQQNQMIFDRVFIHPQDETQRLSATAKRNALFITLYRDYPLFHLPFRLLNTLLDIDEQMATWRYRHINMVQRMIGMRIGTGGSSGKDYLKESMDRHYVFTEIAGLTTFLIDRRQLPPMPEALQRSLGFAC